MLRLLLREKVYISHPRVRIILTNNARKRAIIINSAYLDDSSFTGDFKDLTLSGLSISELDVDNLSESTR